MKSVYPAVCMLLLMATALFPQKAQACLDPDSVIVFASYDTIDTKPCPTANQIELRVSNIRMMTESPGRLCACALADKAKLYDQLIYIAFVDSGTNKPYDGFAKFNANEKSSAQWKGSYGNKGDWSGFVAKVVNDGLKASSPVELVIRAKAPNGMTVIIQDSTPCSNDLLNAVAQSALGTDEWDGDKEELKGAHQMVRTMRMAQTIPMKTATYFEELDKEVLTALSANAPVFIFKEHDLSVYPNPSQGRLNLEMDLVTDAKVEVTWVDLMGREVTLVSKTEFARGKHNLDWSPATYELGGTGLLRVNINGQTTTKRVMVW